MKIFHEIYINIKNNMSPDNLEIIGNFEGWGLTRIAFKKVSVISMKLCTRIHNVKKRSTIVQECLDEWVFLENYFAVTSSNIDVANFSESFITTITRKLYSFVTTSCLKWTFHLFLQHDNVLTQTPWRILWDHLGLSEIKNVKHFKILADINNTGS